MATLDNTTDPVLWVRLLAPHEASRGPNGETSYRLTLRVRVASLTCTGFDVLSSPKVPKPGEGYFGWSLSADNYTYSKNAALIDPSVSLAHANPRRHPSDPLTFDVDLSFEGEGSALLDIPEVEYGETPFQVSATSDANNKPYLNAAGDPLDGGVLIDGDRDVLTITRLIPWADYDTEVIRSLKHSLNMYPFAHCGRTTKVPVDPFGDPTGPTQEVPLTSPAGSCKLSGVTGTRVLLRRGPTPADCVFAARVTARIEIDHRTYVDNDQTRQPQLWKGVRINAGYNELVYYGSGGQSRKRRVTAGAFGQGGAALLDADGSKLQPPTAPGATLHPKVLVFDDYPTKDWSPLANILANW